MQPTCAAQMHSTACSMLRHAALCHPSLCFELSAHPNSLYIDMSTKSAGVLQGQRPSKRPVERHPSVVIASCACPAPAKPTAPSNAGHPGPQITSHSLGEAAGCRSLSQNFKLPLNPPNGYCSVASLSVTHSVRLRGWEGTKAAASSSTFQRCRRVDLACTARTQCRGYIT